MRSFTAFYSKLYTPHSSEIQKHENTHKNYYFRQNKSTKRGEVAWVHAPWRPNTANTAERVAPPPRAPSQVPGESVRLIMHGM